MIFDFIQKKDFKDLLPFLSVLLIIFFLFMNVFIEVETQRMNYAVLKLLKDYREVKDDYYIKRAEYAQKMSPSYIHKTAQKTFPLKDVYPGQIIQIEEKFSLDDPSEGQTSLREF